MTVPAKSGQAKSAAQVFHAMQTAHEDHSLRIADAAAPWWFRAPSVMLACLRFSLFPLELAIRAAEAAMAFIILAILAIAFFWWTGAISDAEIVSWLTPIGDRILAMIEQAAG